RLIVTIFRRMRLQHSTDIPGWSKTMYRAALVSPHSAKKTCRKLNVLTRDQPKEPPKKRSKTDQAARAKAETILAALNRYHRLLATEFASPAHSAQERKEVLDEAVAVLNLEAPMTPTEAVDIHRQKDPNRADDRKKARKMIEWNVLAQVKYDHYTSILAVCLSLCLCLNPF